MESLTAADCAVCSAGDAAEERRVDERATRRQWPASSRPPHRGQRHCEIEGTGERAPSAPQLSPDRPHAHAHAVEGVVVEDGDGDE